MWNGITLRGLWNVKDIYCNLSSSHLGKVKQKTERDVPKRLKWNSKNIWLTRKKVGKEEPKQRGQAENKIVMC